jgi:very-short-patch-repair endonuclease
MSWSEARLWSALRGRELGVRFRRQVPIGPFIADFACLNPKIVIEIDGASHDWTDEEPRTRYIEAQGFTVLRFDNHDIRDSLTGVCAQIEDTIAGRRAHPTSHPM